MNHLLILDTGPLWELVLYGCVVRLGFEKRRTDLTFVRETRQYDRLSSFIGSFRKRTTTPGVIAEISRRIQDTRPGHSAVWVLFRNELVQMGMEEELIKLLEMPTELVSAYGAVDTSILSLGLRHSALRPCILTGDNPLRQECQNHRLDARHICEVVL